MQTNTIVAKTGYLITRLALIAFAASVHAAPTQLTNSPLSGASSVEIQPNILFVLDDSGSMDWDYLPDWAGLATQLYQSKNPSFNGVAYNPTITYTPPKYFNTDGSANTTTYLSQSSANTSAWTTVKNDGYGVQSTASSSLIGNAFYFTTVAGEYCTNKSMKSCTAASAPSVTYPIAAKLRWCATAAEAAAATPTAGACQATQIEPNPAPPATATNIPFNFARMPSPRTSTITFSGSSSTSISSIQVNAQEILSVSIAATTVPATMASNIESSINACTFGLTGGCQVVGYSAVASAGTVTISAPGAVTYTPVITKSGSMSVTGPTAFARPASNLAPGENLLTVITGASSTFTKATTRSDCAADPCTYAEEMTNYANWWAYYRTRMQTMKTATSLSFQPITGSFRVGYSTINNNTTTDFQNIASFDAAQKKAWYDKVFAAIPNQNTPLRVALANAGRLYAGRLNSTSFNGVSVVDPVQHYCQQNVTILSTDGYWNEGAGFQWNGTSAVGDQDGPGLETRPQLDGGGPQDQQSTLQNRKVLTPTTATWLQKKTEQLQSKSALLETRTFTDKEQRTATLQSKTGQWQSQDWKLQSRTNNVQQISTLTRIQQQLNDLESRTGPLRERTANLQTRTKTQTQERTAQLESRTGQRQSKTYQLVQRLTQVQKRTSSNGGTSWTGWANVASCSPVTSGTNRAQCQTLSVGSWNNASSCTVIAGGTTVTNPGTDSEVTTFTTKSECKYQDSPAPSWQNVGSCTAIAQSTSPNYTVEAPVDCQTVGWSGWSSVSSCTASPSVECQYNPSTWTGWSNVGSCSATPKSTASPYTVGVARECRTAQWTPWADTASTCIASSTVECQYGGWSGYSNNAACVATASTASPYTVTVAKECAVNYGSWTTTGGAACSPVTTGSPQTQCRYAGWGGWSDVGSCSTVAVGPPYTGPARNCQTLWTAAVNGACTPGPGVTCTTTWSNWADVVAPGGCTATSTGGTGGSGTTECRYRLLADWYNSASCVSSPRSSSPNYTVNVATDCQVTWPNGWVNATGTCTTATDMQCQYTGWTGWVPATGGCAASPQVGTLQSTVSPYSVLSAKECRTDWTNWSTVGSCTPSPGATECQTTWPNPWVNAASCTSSPTLQCQTVTTSSPEWGPALPAATAAVPPVSSGISCSAGTVGGLTTSCQYLIPNPSLPIPALTCLAETADASNGFVETTCSPVTSGPTDVASCTEIAPVLGNLYVKTSCSVVEKGPTPDTLADVAEYYWKTDLRDPLQSPDKCTGGPVVSGGITSYNNVCTNDLKYPRQFMSTYTLGLGASGLMQYQSDYLSATSGDFFSVKEGSMANPSTGVCSWQKNGVCNWPKPESNKQTNIDDLWHAAVNGRGSYFSADNPSALAAGITSALSSITAKEGSLTAVTVTSPNLVAGDNGVFEITFKAGEWTGDLAKRTIDGTTGVLSATPLWSAQAKLDAKVSTGTHTARTIYTYNSGGESATGLSDNLKHFLWANLSTAEADYFLKPNIATLSQFCSVGTTCLDSATQDDVGHTKASGENLLKFIRGDKSHEGPLSDLGAYYRERIHLLGDIVGGEAVYVGQSPWAYADYQYSAFKATNLSRTSMVYVAANDGMLHAFDSATGVETWAYVPAIVMPNLFKLADKSYSQPGMHRFFVDGTPSMGDICASNCATPASGTPTAVWKTILVGGLNNGGRGYYALDVTNPAAPKALWEFTDNNLGYSYGNPVITKLKDGTWVVIVTSGYNNVSPGDGKGRLFILNANTGALIRSIATSEGSTTTPSGLSRITAWANFPNNNNTALRVYGGDLQGNLWRFDVNGDILTPPPATPSYVAQRIATLKDANGAVQPITSKPEIGKIKSYPVVFIGTGQLLGSDDLSTTSPQQQTLYAIKDRLSAEDYGSPRPLTPAQTTPTPGSFVAQTMTNTTLMGAALTCASGQTYCDAGQSIVKSTANAVDFSAKDGWYVDFPVVGERVNTDLHLQLGTLVFNTNTPKSGNCVPVGTSFSYFLDYRTGGYVEGTSGLVGAKLGDYLASSSSVVRLEDGSLKQLIRTDAPSTDVGDVPTAPTLFDTRRVSWRELVTE